MVLVEALSQLSVTRGSDRRLPKENHFLFAIFSVDKTDNRAYNKHGSRIASNSGVSQPLYETFTTRASLGSNQDSYK